MDAQPGICRSKVRFSHRPIWERILHVNKAYVIQNEYTQYVIILLLQNYGISGVAILYLEIYFGLKYIIMD